MSYQRCQERKKRITNLRKNGGPAWFSEEKNRWVQFSWHDYNRYLKKHCRRQTRRTLNRKGEDFISQQKSNYKKEYDYWNELV